MRAWAYGLALLTLVASQGSRPRDRSLPPPSGTPFVTRIGATLIRQGEPFRFVGVNCFRLAEYTDQVDAMFATFASHGIRVVRFWAFQSYCGATGLDFSRFDVLFAAARRHDLLLLPVLDNHWRDCTGNAAPKTAAWYATGWKTDRSEPLAYRDFLRALAHHFRDEPHVLLWQLMNEPEIDPDTEASFVTLRRFAAEASRELRRADPNHLISLGLLGLGQPGSTGQRFQALHRVDDIDVVTAHDYGYVQEPLPGRTGDRWENSVYADLRDARALGKPFLVTESGISLAWAGVDPTRRAEWFCRKLRALFDAGGVGCILWNYEPVPETEHGFDETDPVMDVLRQVASER